MRGGKNNPCVCWVGGEEGVAPGRWSIVSSAARHYALPFDKKYIITLLRVHFKFPLSA